MRVSPGRGSTSLRVLLVSWPHGGEYDLLVFPFPNAFTPTLARKVRTVVLDSPTAIALLRHWRAITHRMRRANELANDLLLFILGMTLSITRLLD